MLLKPKKYSYKDMVTMSLKTSPFYSIFEAIITIFDALIPTFSIFVTANFINSTIAVYNNESDISSVYYSIGLFAAIIIYKALNGIVKNLIDSKRSIYYRKKLIPEMLKKRAELEYRYIENPETADLINRVCPPFDGNVWNMYKQIINLVGLVIFVIGIVVALFVQVWWIALLMLILSIPIMFIATKAGQNSYNADRKMSKIDRRVGYLSYILKSRDTVEERSIYGYTESLNNQYAEKFDFARKFRLKVLRNNIIKQKSGGLVTSLFAIGTMITLITPVVNGDINFGMFIALIGAVFSLADKLSWGVNEIFSDLTNKREYLNDLSIFMSLTDCEDATALPKNGMMFDLLEFKNISFKYPGTDKLILDNISFKIKRGKHYSFVGANGAGKTTITKLITGLYNNYDGEIFVDGRSYRELTQSEIKGISSVVFQDFSKYSISFYDNIAVADLENYNNINAVKNAVESVGLNKTLSKLNNGFDTPLGKVFENGVDLSGGEWQRLAMARCIVSNKPLKILDEPTAALDPVGESMVYRNFEEISKGVTTIFISHRLGSTKLADVIYVISNGKIVENGSHLELIELDGTYAEMYKAQADWYKNEFDEAGDFKCITK